MTHFLRSAIALLALPLLLLSCTKDSSPSQGAVTDSITVGGLFSLTGNWSSLGVNSAAALRLATDDINVYLKNRGVNFRLAHRIYDTKLDPSLASNSLDQGMSQDKIKYFIGPQSSAELTALKDKIATGGIVAISQGSTASSLALPGDAIFRFCPGDQVEGKAMAKTLWSKGKTYVITMARDDAGNKGLQNAIGAFSRNLGAVVDALTPYPSSTTDFSSLLSTLKAKIQTNAGSLGADRVAVYLASFDEAKDIFHQAASDPVFASVEWFGGDGVVLSNVLVSDPLAADFAMRAHFFAPNFGVPSTTNPDHDRVFTAIKTATGIDPDAYALSVYDAAWVLARTLSSYPSVRTDLNVFKTAFVSEAGQYYGVSGPVMLDANGDRASGTFDYYGISNSGGASFSWIWVGRSE